MTRALLLAIAAAGTLLFASTPLASATPCAFSYEDGVGYIDLRDSVVMPSFPAPDIEFVSVTLDSACVLTIQYEMFNRPNGLFPGDSLAWALNTDGNDATGDRGADYFIWSPSASG